MKIYTKTGDKGETSLFGGKRVSKANPLLEAYGSLDELNSFIGVLRACLKKRRKEEIKKETDGLKTEKSYSTIYTDLEKQMNSIQNILFHMGSHLASTKESLKDKLPCLKESFIKNLEEHIDSMDQDLEPLRQFILPGGSESACFAHQARSVCRRAERQTVALGDKASSLSVSFCIEYLNRLSDYFFVLARFLNHLESEKEVLWNKEGD